MSTLNDIDEVLRAHGRILPGGAGAPIIANGQRVGNSLLRAATTLVSAALQSEVEKTFRQAVPLTFDHFTPDQVERFTREALDRWGNPNPDNIRRLFFKIGFPDVLDGLSWQKCNNTKVIEVLDAVNQVRNRVAHGQPLTVNGQTFRLTKPTVRRWRNFVSVFEVRFGPHVIDQYDD
jgi:hypothetical protein